jgi:multiple antibiotic resistance protein
LQATLASGGLMILFLLVGQQFLNILGLDVKSFAVAGSIVIFIIGLEMVLGIEFFKPDSDPKSGSVVPIAFPLIAGSGTLTTIMSLKANYNDANILIGILINCIVIFLVLKSLSWIERMLRAQRYDSNKKIFWRNIAGHCGKNIWYQHPGFWKIGSW